MSDPFAVKRRIESGHYDEPSDEMIEAVADGIRPIVDICPGPHDFRSWCDRRGVADYATMSLCHSAYNEGLMRALEIIEDGRKARP